MNRGGVCETVRVALVSHAYSEPTLQQQIVAVDEFVDVRLIAPRNGRALVFENFVAQDSGSGITHTYRRFRVFGAQYLLGTMTFGFLRLRPTVIHVDYDPWHAIFWQVYLAKKLFARRAKLVVSAKKNTYRSYPGLAGRVKFSLASYGYSRIDHVIAASSKARTMLLSTFKLPPTAVSVATHVGVGTDTFRPSGGRSYRDDHDLVIGYCGRFSEHKGLRDLLHVVEEMVTDGWCLRLALLGAGPMYAELIEKARQSGWLEVLDAVPTAEVAEYLRRLDIYVLPALRLEDHEEHDGHALLQAMSCGVPPVASNSGIIPEIIDSDALGKIYVSGSRSGLREALEALCSSKKQRLEVAANVRRRVQESYSLSEVARQKAEIYAGLL